MAAKWEKLEGNVGVLTIEVDAKEVNNSIDAAFKKVVQTINVPGFRKGKMPRPLFEQRFGIESLYQDALDIILPKAYGEAIDEAGIFPVDHPEINIEKFEKNANLIFTAKVTVKPEVKLGEYKGLAVEKVETTVTDEDVENELKSLQERQAELVVKEEGTVENGDTAVIDFEGFVDGEAFEGGKGENYSLAIGSGTFIPGFEEQVIGLKSGDSKEVEVSFPEEYHAAELAGKPATFKVTIHEIKTKELPELNDEFAKEADEEVATLDELKTKLRTNLEEGKKHEAENKVRDEVVELAAANAEIEIPEAMIDTELDRMVREFEQRLSQQGMNLELYYQFTGTDADKLKEQMKEDAQKRVRINLVLEAIIEAENIEVTEEEVTAEVEKMAEMYGMPVDAIKQALGSVDALSEDLKVRKAVDFLVDNAA
ncbi:trigger factor [Bacillus wiedmannii]|uniref:Trigger factor n=1 Tax=Bacillus wiedmannii TaxID=1890302 RepID=A0A2B6UJS8_9BACI|nr:trigger factor [Bacillus wiedmannii]PEJ99287.1 trigger factor [Bacillus wiedmannii]PEM33587.1 trigger factor [Bacillus wiedmannii]PEM89041.1 trigger factor [Bacillus wiedmannii]PEO87070.1 trigger factor [Bacillus wiedmannii]PEP29311.1 trigger factor [Bacillus wiedmannii]